MIKIVFKSAPPNVQLVGRCAGSGSLARAAPGVRIARYANYPSGRSRRNHPCRSKDCRARRFLRRDRPDPALGNLSTLLFITVGVYCFSRRIGEIRRPSIRTPANAVGVFHHGYRLDHGRSKSQGSSIRNWIRSAILAVESRLLNLKEMMPLIRLYMPCITQAALRSRSGE